VVSFYEMLFTTVWSHEGWRDAVGSVSQL